MNNAQFRKLVQDTPARQPAAGESGSSLRAAPKRDGDTPSTLGSRMRSSIPMTPRSIARSGGVDFARQMAERAKAEQPQKKFRSTAAPKGTKLLSGYVDRTKSRVSEEDDDKAARVKALEEMMKLQQIDEPTFIKLRDEILGGDVSSTHLVKGLDYKLLERVKRGEDVLSGQTGKEEDHDEPEEDVDDEFEKLEDREITAVRKERVAKKGEQAPTSLVPGKKRNRDQILAEMKAARLAAKEAAQPSLGARFKKVGGPRATSRIERDSKGREVLITIDEDGHEKRKVRKMQPELETEKGHGLLMPDKDAKPLGMEVPEILKTPVEEDEEDVNIFDDVGDDYDPLAGLGDDDSEVEVDQESGETKEKKVDADDITEEKPASTIMAPPPRPKQPAGSRNYFGDVKSDVPKPTGHEALSDPTILAALKKASNLNPLTAVAENAEEAAKEARRKKMLQRDDRDAQDMDMGFGSSRFEDEEDFEDKKVKLSQWGSKGGDDEEHGGTDDGKGKRKRGPKKRKGDGNNAADVMRVLESRRAAADK